MANEAKDSAGAALAVGDSVKTTQAISVPKKGDLPAGTALKVKAFGRSPNHIDVEFNGATWFIDAKTVKKG